ncbi:hypothetical protein BHM03_00002338 [Ensete ventricosum]|uniref:Uncharacterized protein n=1 Tax=Ensete ventricosum TaxID=4639 RepID=A0A445M9L5_ENSVE|nr:hypothetical protein BHM03_00002338 [Ensete ventricosum]
MSHKNLREPHDSRVEATCNQQHEQSPELPATLNRPAKNARSMMRLRLDQSTMYMYKSGTPRGLSLSLSLSLSVACSLPLALLQSKREAPTPKEETPDFTLQNNSNLIVGGTAPGTHHPGEGLVLQEQSNEVRRTCIKVTTWGSDHPPLGDATKRSEPAPSASACSFLHLDTLSSNSTGSLREQLCLVNQRIDDVLRTLRTKDERAEVPSAALPSSRKFKMDLFHHTFASRCWRRMTATPIQQNMWLHSMHR